MGRKAIVINRESVFGRLTVLERLKNGDDGATRYLCRCVCGNECVVRGSFLQRGHTRSCGCLQKENTSTANSTHGGSTEQLYFVYQNIIRRCYERKNKAYCHYGGRGITVCEEWLGNDGYSHFRDWAYSNGYCKGLSIDRIDVNGNYEPCNCRWADWKTQENNRSNNHILFVNGEAHTISEWARIKSISPNTLMSRIIRGWTDEAVVNTPILKRGGF